MWQVRRPRLQSRPWLQVLKGKQNRVMWPSCGSSSVDQRSPEWRRVPKGEVGGLVRSLTWGLRSPRMITREGNQRLMQRREAGQMVKICLAGPNSVVWTLFLSAAFFNGEGTVKQSVAWHLQAWATGRGPRGCTNLTAEWAFAGSCGTVGSREPLRKQGWDFRPYWLGMRTGVWWWRDYTYKYIHIQTLHPYTRAPLHSYTHAHTSQSQTPHT